MCNISVDFRQGVRSNQQHELDVSVKSNAIYLPRTYHVTLLNTTIYSVEKTKAPLFQILHQA